MERGVPTIDKTRNYYSSDMIGHELIRTQMLQSIKNRRISHAHIILGEEGMGKSLVAYAVLDGANQRDLATGGTRQHVRLIGGSHRSRNERRS